MLTRALYPFPSDDGRPLMIEATLKDGSTVNLVNDTLIDDKIDYAAVVEVTADGLNEITGKIPFDEAERRYAEIYDERRASGDRPVVTYHSYD